MGGTNAANRWLVGRKYAIKRRVAKFQTKNYSFGIGKTGGVSILRTLSQPESRRQKPWLDTRHGSVSQAFLPDGVTVARVTLTHLVEVQILVGQLAKFA